MLTDAAIVKAKVKYWLDALTSKFQIIAPVNTGTMIEYVPIERGEEALLEFKTPTIAPKVWFFPKTETVLRYQVKKNSVNVLPAPVDTTERVIFGVKPCDAKALLLLDKQLVTETGVDPFYQARRERTTLVGIGTPEPFDTEFSVSVGSSPFGEEGLDILFIDMGKEYYVKVFTEKGKRLLDANFSPADDHHRKTAVDI
ncbi:MAG: hypothetical protein ACREJQ_05775, partial [bacterium]